MEPVFSEWLTGTLSDDGWGPRDRAPSIPIFPIFVSVPIIFVYFDEILIFSYISAKIFLYFSYILSFRIPIFLFFCQKIH